MRRRPVEDAAGEFQADTRPPWPADFVLSAPASAGTARGSSYVRRCLAGPQHGRLFPLGDALELGRQVGLEALALGGHIVGVAEVLADQPVQAVAGGVLLGGLGARDDVTTQLDPGVGYFAEVDL